MVPPLIRRGFETDWDVVEGRGGGGPRRAGVGCRERGFWEAVRRWKAAGIVAVTMILTFPLGNVNLCSSLGVFHTINSTNLQLSEG